ncbi:hypothetical protein SLNWT_0154 [Streptomyces albus]|uniref:Uncharacterized protein n=1 Tax=Streptomyces albus (strain ATCC 21838 / DSM 41398 / FERM P-419 / JCM 4703 / NBRC 107858) TaxID=1081613 RepID=A0A0B5EMF3_STRA4|nr:hypothetical protein SLNWT_0154 [Streptomyces albus]
MTPCAGVRLLDGVVHPGRQAPGTSRGTRPSGPPRTGSLVLGA